MKISSNNHWIPVKNYEKLYKVSIHGNVLCLKSGKLRTIQIKPDKYCYIGLRKHGKIKNFYIHRLVATAFIDNPFNKPEVNHKNSNRLDNNVNNLEWVTKSENEIHAYKYNNKQAGKPFLGKKGVNSINSKKVIQLSKDGNIINCFDSITIASEKTKINRRGISAACKGKTNTSGGFKWKYV